MQQAEHDLNQCYPTQESHMISLNQYFTDYDLTPLDNRISAGPNDNQVMALPR